MIKKKFVVTELFEIVQAKANERSYEVLQEVLEFAAKKRCNYYKVLDKLKLLHYRLFDTNKSRLCFRDTEDDSALRRLRKRFGFKTQCGICRACLTRTR